MLYSSKTTDVEAKKCVTYKTGKKARVYKDFNRF